MADFITQALQELITARGDAEIAALMAAKGHTAEKLTEGLTVQVAAQRSG
jgi:hypothetical protein